MSLKALGDSHKVGDKIRLNSPTHGEMELEIINVNKGFRSDDEKYTAVGKVKKTGKFSLHRLPSVKEVNEEKKVSNAYG